MPTSYFSACVSGSTVGLEGDILGVGTLHRVDAPHQVSQDQSPPASSTKNACGSLGIPAPLATRDTCNFDAAELRAAHSEDLIEFLQQWSEELDDRAARLNAAIATHERRERAFRLWMQNRRQELEVQISDYRDAQGRAEAIARRLAVGG